MDIQPHRYASFISEDSIKAPLYVSSFEEVVASSRRTPIGRRPVLEPLLTDFEESVISFEDVEIHGERQLEARDMKSEIVLALRRHGTLRLSGIAKKIGRSESGVHYQLQKMEEQGLVVRTEAKHYRLADTKEIERVILEALQRRTLTPKEILQSKELRSFDEAKVRAVFDKMITTGLLERVEELEFDEQRIETVEKGFKLSFLGCRELGVCYFCNEPVNDGFAIQGIVSEVSYTSVDYGLPLHPACVAKWLDGAYGEGDFYGVNTSCDFCGLPLSANHLIGLLGPRDAVDVSDLRRYLSPEENQALGEKTESSSPLFVPVRYVESRSDIEQTVSSMAKAAKEKGIEIGEYDQQARIDQLWTIAQALIERKRSKLDNMLRICGPLLEPISVVYSQLSTYWAHHLKRYEILASRDVKSGQVREELLPTSFLEGAHAAVMRENGKQYHLYCYRLAREFRMLPLGQKTSEQTS